MASRKAGERRRPVVYVRRYLVILYLGLLVAWPVSAVFSRAFGSGLGTYRQLLSDPDVQTALRLTVVVAVASVVLNAVFGLGTALLLTRSQFRGKHLLNALIDLPMAVSPVVVGLSLVLVYGGRDGWFGPWLEAHGVTVIFAPLGMVLATTFVAMPLVVRELVPVLEVMGTDQEVAARSLGASPWQTFRRITLPGIRWALVYGVVLSLARSLGEFGAVKIVSGNVLGQTRTATLLVEDRYHNFDKSGAYALAALLALVSIACITLVTVIRPKETPTR